MSNNKLNLQNANQAVGPCYVQQGHGEPIAVGDHISIHYAISESSKLEPHFSTYGMGPLSGFAQKENSDLWMFGTVVGQRLGDQFWHRKDDGIYVW